MNTKKIKSIVDRWCSIVNENDKKDATVSEKSTTVGEKKRVVTGWWANYPEDEESKESEEEHGKH